MRYTHCLESTNQFRVMAFMKDFPDGVHVVTLMAGLGLSDSAVRCAIRFLVEKDLVLSRSDYLRAVGMGRRRRYWLAKFKEQARAWIEPPKLRERLSLELRARRVAKAEIAEKPVGPVAGERKPIEPITNPGRWIDPQECRGYLRHVIP